MLHNEEMSNQDMLKLLLCLYNVTQHSLQDASTARRMRWAEQHDINHHFEHECDYQPVSEHTRRLTEAALSTRAVLV